MIALNEGSAMSMDKKNRQFIHYTVKPTDTWERIALKFFRDPGYWRDIAAHNNIEEPRILEPGTVLVIPRIDRDG